MKIHVKIQGKTFSVKLGDIQTRPIQAEVNGEVFEVWPEETLIPSETSLSISSTSQIHRPAPIMDSHASAGAHGKQSNTINAPIPGVVVEISVQSGETVTFGQELCVLEAMKMKNSIRANRDGIVKSINAQLDEHVHQGQLLIELEVKDN